MTRADDLRDALVARIDDTGFAAHGLHVRVGDDVAMHRWTPDEREEIHSVAKAVAVLAAGIAADEGLASLDEPVRSMLPAATEVTLRELLSMSSGIDLPWSETMMTDWPDLAAEFLSRPSPAGSSSTPTPSTYTAMAALSQRTGDIEEILRPRLFAPLGWADLSWRRSPSGRVLGGEGLELRTTSWLSARVAHPRPRHRRRSPRGGRRNRGCHALGLDRDGERRRRVSPLRPVGVGRPGDAWRLHGAHGQLIVFVGEAVVTVTAHDHGGPTPSRNSSGIPPRCERFLLCRNAREDHGPATVR